MICGIVSYGLYLPKNRQSAEELAAEIGVDAAEIRALGIEEKPVPGPEEQPVSMAAKAAGQAFERAGGITPQDVDLVIWTGEEYKDYIAQTAAIRLQEEVGCKKAWAYDLVGQGVTPVVGMRVARDMMISDETISTVLLAGGTRNIDLVDPKRGDTRFLLTYSASGAAMILRRGHAENVLLNVSVSTDPQMADEVYVPGGGTEIPFAENNLNSDLMFFQVQHPEKVVAYLDDVFVRRLAQEASHCLNGDKADYLALRHMNPARRRKVLEALGISEDKSASLVRLGHHGGNDAVLSLDKGLNDGIIKPGSVVVMVTAGIGYTYAAATVKWGPM